jgi:hypothetical protein
VAAAATIAAARAAAGSVWTPPADPPSSLPGLMAADALLLAKLPGLALLLEGSFGAAAGIFERLKAQPDPDATSPLTFDEVFSITLYSYDDCGGRQDQWYFFLNTMLREKPADMMRALEPYLTHFRAGLLKLPTKELICYRGIKLSTPQEVESLKKGYSVGSSVEWRSVSSVSSDAAVAKSFQQGAALGVAFVISVKTARSISKYSYLPAESELLLWDASSGSSGGSSSIKFIVMPPMRGISGWKTGSTVFLQELASGGEETVY